MAVEVETYRGDTVSGQRVGDNLKQRTFLAAAETVHQHHHGAARTRGQHGLLYHGGYLALAAVYRHTFLRAGVHLGGSRHFIERALQFVGKHRGEHHLAVGVYQHHRGYPLHTVSGRNGGLLPGLQLAHLGVAYAILLQGLAPGGLVGVERYTHKLHAALTEPLPHVHHHRGVLAAVAAP